MEALKCSFLVINLAVCRCAYTTNQCSQVFGDKELMAIFQSIPPCLVTGLLGKIKKHTTKQAINVECRNVHGTNYLDAFYRYGFACNVQLVFWHAN